MSRDELIAVVWRQDGQLTVLSAQVAGLLSESRMQPHSQNGHVPTLLTGSAASHHRAEVVNELLDAAPGGDETIPARFLECPMILLGRGMIKDQEDGKIPEQHPGLASEEAAKPVAIHGFAAGVGKGTVFRRFGSRAGLMMVLLDEDERAMQHAVLFGPPPLGPDAAPLQRLLAFGRERLRFVDLNYEAATLRRKPTPMGDPEKIGRFLSPSGDL